MCGDSFRTPERRPERKNSVIQRRQQVPTSYIEQQSRCQTPPLIKGPLQCPKRPTKPDRIPGALDLD